MNKEHQSTSTTTDSFTDTVATEWEILPGNGWSDVVSVSEQALCLLREMIYDQTVIHRVDDDVRE